MSAKNPISTHSGGGQIVMCWAVILICQPRPTGPLGSDSTALEFADGRVSFKMEFGMLHLLHERRWVELAKFTKPYCSYELWLVGSDALTLKEMYLYDFWHTFLFPLFTVFFCFPSKVEDSSKNVPNCANLVFHFCPSLNTQSCIRGLLVVRDFYFWAV